MNAETQAAICENCQYFENFLNEGQWCYMMDKILIGCQQYKQ